MTDPPRRMGSGYSQLIQEVLPRPQRGGARRQRLAAPGPARASLIPVARKWATDPYRKLSWNLSNSSLPGQSFW